MNNQNQKKKIIIGIVAMVVLIATMVCVYISFRPKAAQGTKAYSLEVVDDSGKVTSYEGKTDAEYLVGLMDELQASGDFTYEGTEGDYGLYINTVNGLTADYDADGAYWSIMVNGEYGMYGASEQPVDDGDSFQFVYTVY